MIQGIADILAKVDSLKTKKERVEELTKHKDNLPMKVMLDLAFNPKVKFLLPETDPPYKPNDKEADAQNVLMYGYKKMTYFLDTPAGNGLRPHKREMLFIEMLESMDPDDAVLLLHVKNKKLPYKNITKDVVAQSFPGIENYWK